MDSKELDKIIKIAKKHGAKSLEVNGIKLEFAESTQISPPQKPVLNLGGSLSDLDDSEPEPSPDEMLFRSSPYYDVMMAQRKDALKPESN